MDKDKLIRFEEDNGIFDLRDDINKLIEDNIELEQNQKRELKDKIEMAIFKWVEQEVIDSFVDLNGR